jgi:LacI family transcriptional regulator
MAPPEGIEEDIKSLINDGMPVVLFDRHLPNVDTDFVEIDNLFSAYNATQHLAEQGFKNIAFVTFISSQIQMIDRVKGYQQAINNNNLKATIEEITFSQDDEQIMQSFRDFLKTHPEVNAVLFGNNHIGTCGLKVMKELGL